MTFAFIRYKICISPRFSLLLGFLWGVFCIPAQGQVYHRVEADFSIKEAWNDTTSRLVMGKVFFDKNEEKIVYKVDFPEPQMWVVEDSFFHTATQDTLISTPVPPEMLQLSVFNLVLQDELGDYGLTDSLYSKSKVERRNGLIISTWKPHPRLAAVTGDILISRKGKLLYGVVFMNAAGEIVSKQFSETTRCQQDFPSLPNLYKY